MTKVTSLRAIKINEKKALENNSADSDYRPDCR